MVEQIPTAKGIKAIARPYSNARGCRGGRRRREKKRALLRPFATGVGPGVEPYQSTQLLQVVSAFAVCGGIETFAFVLFGNTQANG